MRLMMIALLLQVLSAPDPAQMEDAPDLGYRAVPHGLQIPAEVEMGAPSSVAWTSTNTLLVFNRGPNPLMEFTPAGRFVRSWGHGEYRGGPHPLDRFSSQLRWNPVHDSKRLRLLAFE